MAAWFAVAGHRMIFVHKERMDSMDGVALRTRQAVLGSLVDVMSWSDAETRVMALAQRKVGAYVCICNVHSIVTAWRSPEFQLVLNEADMVTPDGAPVAWALRAMGHKSQARINGPDLMWRICERASQRGVRVFLYGSTEETVRHLMRALATAFPNLIIAGYHCPPFRPLTQAEDEAVVKRICDSGAGIVFVSLGCPKQERWIAEHRRCINTVTLGVGAAFEYHAGTVRRAPPWMQRHGLEWLYRLRQEPRRLWKRYLVTNTLFMVGIAAQLLRRVVRPKQNAPRN